MYNNVESCYNKFIVLGGFMSIILYIGVFILNIIYIFLKLFPTKNKIVFISRQSDKPSLDFRMLAKEINKTDNTIKIVFLNKRTRKNIKDNLKNIKNTFFQMYHLATSKVCITDGYNITISNLKHKKNLTIIQMWHALGAIKKFGYQTLNTPRKIKIAKILHMHKNYDYIISGSKAMTRYFSKAFNYPQSYFVNLGLPRIDYILSYNKINRNKIYKKYPELIKRKTILYVPTFRDDNNYKIDELINNVNLNKYALIIKEHPNMNIDKSRKIKNLFYCEDFTSLQLLSIADIVVTDYSAISIEASILEKPVYLYVYDYEEYRNNPGLNIDLEKAFPRYVFKDAKSLFENIDKNKYDLNVIRNFKNKYICNTHGTVTKNICNFILKKGVYYDKEN